MPKSILAFECSSLGCTYAQINQLAGQFTIEILEASWMAVGRCFALIAVNKEDFESIDAQLKAQPEITDIQLIADIQQPVLDAYFNLLQTPIEASLLIAELPSLPNLLALTNKICIQHPKVKLIEIRPYRMTPGPAVAILTGDTSALKRAQEIVASAAVSQSAVLIEECADQFREFYNIDGNI